MKKYRCKEDIVIYDRNMIFKDRELHQGDIVSIESFYENLVILRDDVNRNFTMGYLVFKDFFEEVKDEKR